MDLEHSSSERGVGGSSPSGGASVKEEEMDKFQKVMAVACISATGFFFLVAISSQEAFDISLLGIQFFLDAIFLLGSDGPIVKILRRLLVVLGVICIIYALLALFI